MKQYTVACFDDDEGVFGLYEDNKLIVEGDDYHNDVRVVINSFFFALDHFGIDYIKARIDVVDFDCVYGPEIPRTLEELEGEYECRPS